MLSVLVPNVVSSGGQYCLLALEFAFVWWSSRTFFVAGAALIPAAGAVLFTLVSARGMGLVPAAMTAGLISVMLAAIIETGIMRPMAGWRTRKHVSVGHFLTHPHRTQFSRAWREAAGYS